MEEQSTFLKDVESVKLYREARDLAARGDLIKALEIIEDLIFVHNEDMYLWFLHIEQGKMFIDLAARTESCYLDFTYMLGSAGCFSKHILLSRPCAHRIYYLAQAIGSVLYCKKCVKVAKQGLSVTFPTDLDSNTKGVLEQLKKDIKIHLEGLITYAEFCIAGSKTKRLMGSLPKYCTPEVLELKDSPEPNKNERLRSFWLCLDVKVKRDFMKISVKKLQSFFEGVTSRNALKQVINSARKHRKWRFWMCRMKCLKKFSSAEECKKHLEQQHGADFKPSLGMDEVKRIGKNWARKISNGDWEPVDTAAAVEMIINRLADVKAFACKTGWSKEWPLAVDEERSKLLKEIKSSLVRFCDLKILPFSVIRDCVMQYPDRHLRKLNVSQQILDDSQLLETPQSICFLECHELNQILNFLKRIKCKRDDGIDLVSRAVDSILDSTGIKAKIDFDKQFSFLLLDRRLLKSNNAPIDDEGLINVFDPDDHFGKAPAQGDDIISWLTDYNSVEKTFFRPIREYNLDIWVAVLRAVQFTCSTLETKYAKKMQVFTYRAALTVAEVLIIKEQERRKDLQEDQWNSYASLLCNRCEGSVPGNSYTKKLVVCAIRDVLEGSLDLTFGFPDFEECLNLIRQRKGLSDDIVLKSIDSLKSVATTKVALMDSKILLVDNSRISLLNDLTRLSIFDNRTYILQLLKPFLLDKIVNMVEYKAKSDAAEAAEAELLLEEEKSVKKRSNKKKNNSKKQRTSTSKTVENKPSVNLELESTSPSLTVEGDSMEPGDTLASEIGRLEISSNTVNQEEVMQNMPGEDLQSKHLESALGEAAVRYNSALDMTLKALLNIKILKEDLMHQPFQDHLEEQVPSALQNFVTAFMSEEIQNEGVYSYLLSDLLASLEEVISMSSSAAEVLVAILESWHCWKIAGRESLVTRLFTLEESETTSCRKCRKIPNYPDQSSYGIVMAADSIRELKCSLGDIKFVDILKVIRMENKMPCDIRTGGCGTKTIVHRIMKKRPPIFTIVLEWEKIETEKEISETTKALDWEIDLSRLYQGLEPKTNYRLVSMVGCGEEEHICLVYGNNGWVNLRCGSLAREDVGNWESVVSFCGERKVRPEILFYEAAASIDGVTKK